MNEYVITALPREAKTTPRALRRQGYTPCVMYGRDLTSCNIQVKTAQLARLVNRAGSSVVTISIEGEPQSYNALVREVQRDPVSLRLLHVDFMTVQANQVIRNEVPLVQQGSSPAEQRGGVVIQLLDRLEIECLPADMPHAIMVDISGLTNFNSHLTVADLVIPPHVTVLSAMDAEVIHVMPPMREGAQESATAEESQQPAAETASEGGI